MYIDILEQDHNRERLLSVIKRAMIDPEFRTLLLNDPEAAVEEELGYEPEIAANIQFVEQSEVPGAEGAQATFVLPESMNVSTGAELSEEDLEAVAGGQQQLEACEWTCDESCGC